MNKRPSIIILTTACFALSVLGGCQRKTQKQTPVPHRHIMEVTAESCTLYKPYSTSILSNGAVAVYPKIAGHIFQQHVEEGNLVKKGDLLFTIDPIQMEAAVEVAKANIEAAEAKVQSAQLVYDSKQDLYKKEIISENDLLIAKNDLAAAKANLSQCKAALTTAQRNLEYCKVSSPIDGIAGVINYSPGNLVSTSSPNPLITIADISKMRCYFSISEREALDLGRKYGAPADIAKALPQPSLRLSDGQMYPYKGKVITVSGVPDARTGAIRIRADFPNPEMLLKNGYSGTVLMPVTVNDAILVPQHATFELQSERLVYVLTDSNTVHAVNIQILDLNDGQNFVVTGGLNPGDRIVTEGVNFLHEGQRINPLTCE